jgi:hypothetical protein
MRKPPRLFSWCFPDPEIADHAACPAMFEWNGDVVICECECHE